MALLISDSEYHSIPAVPLLLVPFYIVKGYFPELPQFECALSFPLGPCQVLIWPLLSTRSQALAKFSTSLGLSIFICKTAKSGSQTQVSGTSKHLKWVRWVCASLMPLLSSHHGHVRKQAEGASQFDLSRESRNPALLWGHSISKCWQWSKMLILKYWGSWSWGEKLSRWR